MLSDMKEFDSLFDTILDRDGQTDRGGGQF